MLLFEPIKIGNLTLKNRVILPAFGLAYCPDGNPTERIIDFYEARSLGGAGLIMAGATAINEQNFQGGLLSIGEEKFLEGHKQLTSRVKQHGAKVGLQLFHTGRYAFGFLDGKKVYAPSAIPSKLTRFTPQALTIDEIKEIVADFGVAAFRAREAGYDIVEILCATGYLISQFLSPITNQRSDEYGGSLENRMRFPLEVIQEVRSKVGSDFPISARIAGNDFMPGSNTWKETILFAKELEKHSVDMISVTGGWHETYIPQLPSEVPPAAYTYLAGLVKQNVSIPITASNRINNPETAERVLEDGISDMISIARGFIADPDWAVKAERGKSKSIRRCIGCMVCMENLFSSLRTENEGVHCAVNPRQGREGTTNITKTDSPKKVLIIGAGPAGLEAACTLAMRGHSVQIWEQENRIGGQWIIASVPPGKHEFIKLLDYYDHYIAELGIELKLNKTADRDSILKENADIVMIATGAVPTNVDLKNDGSTPIINAWDVLAGLQVKGPNVVVLGGGATGCETAMFIAEKGTMDAETLKFLMLHKAEAPEDLFHFITNGSYKVSIMNRGDDIGKGMTLRWSIMKHINLLGIKPILNASVAEIKENTIYYEVDGNLESLPVDSVVVAFGSKSVNKLYEELKSDIDNIYLLGDAVSPKRLIDAIHTSFDLALTI